MRCIVASTVHDEKRTPRHFAIGLESRRTQSTVSKRTRPPTWRPSMAEARAVLNRRKCLGPTRQRNIENTLLREHRKAPYGSRVSGGSDHDELGPIAATSATRQGGEIVSAGSDLRAQSVRNNARIDNPNLCFTLIAPRSGLTVETPRWSRFDRAVGIANARPGGGSGME